MADARDGHVMVEIGGETRFLSADLNMADVLFDVLGENYLHWIAERYLGRPETLEGRRVLRFAAIQPKEMMLMLHALLASDRQVSEEKGVPRVETPQTLARSISFTGQSDVEQAVRKALVTCFGVKPDQVQILGLDPEPEASVRAHWGQEL